MSFEYRVRSFNGKCPTCGKEKLRLIASNCGMSDCNSHPAFTVCSKCGYVAQMQRQRMSKDGEAGDFVKKKVLAINA